MSGRPVIVRGTKMRDRTGEVCGAYTVTQPVGTNPLSSEYWRLACPDCGHAIAPRNTQGLAQVSKRNTQCANCGRKAQVCATKTVSGTAKPLAESEACGAS